MPEDLIDYSDQFKNTYNEISGQVKKLKAL